MTPMIKIFLCISTCFLLLLASCGQQQPAQHEGYAYVQLMPFESNPGCWGYEIYVDNKLYIRQDYIPVINGRHPFKTKQAALDAGKLVFDKISSGKKPTLTAEELRGINVIP